MRSLAALGTSINLDYAGSDLAQITDPLNRSSSFFTDSIGRQRSATDALGNRTSVEMDALSRPTQVTDPLNQTTTGLYDANGNQTRITDAKGNLHQFVFDKRNAPTGAVNPLNQTESYLYDGAHNLTQKTDQKGQITRYAYDTLDRMTNTTYADASTVTYTYDQGNRITRIVDAVNGAIALTYDSHDWLLSTTTPKGSVAYTYYANGLRKSMSVPSQPQLTYTYDAGNRLTRIDQAAGAANNNTAQGIAFTYDAADRRIQTRYMNGVTRDDSVDAAGQLTAITYKKPDGTIVGDLAYSYDKGGRRTGASGSLARTSLPSALTSAGVDAANRLTIIGAQALSYDTNGNLIGDGNQSYVWNARNQLAQIKNGSGAIIAAFTYDALGRRQTKTVNGVSSGFVYDGANIVQELSSTVVDNSNSLNVRASYISGGIDEVFAQLSGTGAGSKTLTYLNDALGSTVRLVDSAASKVVDYTYDPYGNTIADATINNPFQYTGRENDGNGLYYYRMRYYSPMLQRFISSDPIGLMGGINTYAYVRGNPVSRIDPLGLRDVIVAIWTSQILSGSVGHVFVGEMNGTTITSQFPSPHGIEGANTTKTWIDTVAAEGRSPDSVYQVTVPNDSAFDAAAAAARNVPRWSAFPNGETSTQCASAAAGALKAGGVGGISSSSSIWPNWVNTDLKIGSWLGNQVTKLPGAPW